jgi:hypothetical protein
MGISVEQDETEPNKYHCDMVFKNLSEFTVKLVNCDIYDSENLDVKYVDLDPADDVYLPGGAEWHSEVFDVESESEEGPQFKEEVKCFLIRSEEVTATSKIQVNDVKLAVASLTGTIAFDRSEIPSYVQVEVQATLTSENDGGAPFNELVMEQFVINGFLPPQADQIKLTFNNDEVPVDPSWLEVVDHTDEETKAAGKLIRIKVENIKEKFDKFYEPGDKFVAVYPIIADKIEKDVNFHAYAKYIGETYPKGLPIEYMVEEKFEIKTVHERRKISKYKDLNALEKEGEWEIILTRENRGNSTIKELKIKDFVPAGFTHGKYSMKKPDIEDKEGGNMLIWTIEALEPGKEVQIKYLITGEAADYDPKKLSVQY